MLEQGTYRAKAKEAALGRTSKGTEQVAVRFELLDHTGESITWFGFFTDKTLENTVKSLRACGWTGDDLSDLAGITANEVNLVVEHETDDRGQTRAKVRWVNGTSGLAMKDQLDTAEAKTFAARMKGAIVAMGKGGARPAAPRPRATGSSSRPPEDDRPPMGDDDIPF